MPEAVEYVQQQLRSGQYAAAATFITQRLADEPACAEADELRLLLAHVWRRCGRMQDAEKEYRALIADAEQRGDTALVLRARLGRGRLLCNQGELARSEIDLNCVTEAAAALPPKALGEYHYLRGQLHFQRHETNSAQQSFEAALAVMQAAGDEYGVAEAQSALGMSLLKQGRNYEGLQLWRKAAAYHEQQGNATEVAIQLQRISFATWCEGDLDATRRTLLHVLQLATEHAASLPPNLPMMACFNLTSVELLAGELDLAERYLAETRQRAEQVGYRILLAELRILDAVLALYRGRYAEALQQRETALAACAEVGHELSPASRMDLALVLAANGRLAEAVAEWPPLPEQPDREECMNLRGVVRILDALLAAAPAGASHDQYSAWQLSLAMLTAE
jgi:tetratricopeptide (TPR) repeat protein